MCELSMVRREKVGFRIPLLDELVRLGSNPG